MRDALARLDVLAVVDVLDGELCALATHVLPATGQLERADVTLAAPLSVRSAVQATRPGRGRRGGAPPGVVDHRGAGPPDGRRHPRGRRPAGRDDETHLRALLHGSPIDADDLFAAGPHGLPLPVEHGWVTGSMLPDGRWRIAPAELVARLAEHQPVDAPLVLVPRREMGWSNSIRYGGGDVAVVHLHPDDAGAAGLADGDEVDVRSEHGELRATVAVDPGVRPGVVSVTHGHDGASPGRLTSRLRRRRPVDRDAPRVRRAGVAPRLLTLG